MGNYGNGGNDDGSDDGDSNFDGKGLMMKGC